MTIDNLNKKKKECNQEMIMRLTDKVKNEDRLRRISKKLWKGVKRFGSNMMEVSRRYHEARAKQPEQMISELERFAEQQEKGD